MNENDILSAARLQLRDAISKCKTTPCEPMNVSPWIAMSALQKAIRRGHSELAQRAAATLLTIAPDRLWRRCGCIAFEDVGVADLDTVALVTAALGGKRFRATLGGEWTVAGVIVKQMALAPKCRAADDLLLMVDLHPALAMQRNELSSRSTSDLLDIATGRGSLPKRALAIRYAVGTNWRTSPLLQPRHGEPRLAFERLAAASPGNPSLDLAREAFRKVREVLCPFVSLLYPERQTEEARIEDDEFLPETMAGNIPSWVLDTYVREGRAALREFLNLNCQTTRWVRSNIPERRRIKFLGDIVFRVEGGLVRSRLRWPTADRLRAQVDLACHGPYCHDASEVLDLMRGDIPLLNAVRANHVG